MLEISFLCLQGSWSDITLFFRRYMVYSIHLIIVRNVLISLACFNLVLFVSQVGIRHMISFQTHSELSEEPVLCHWILWGRSTLEILVDTRNTLPKTGALNSSLDLCCAKCSSLKKTRPLKYTTGSSFTYAAVEQVSYLLADRRVTVQVLIRPVGLSRIMVGSSAAIWQLKLLKDFRALTGTHIAKRVLWCHLSANLLGDHVVVFQTAWRAWKILYLYSSQVLLVIKQHRGHLALQKRWPKAAYL